ncbi:MAG TPA: sigma 54-interacting transcriptional regulator [Kofleriaceae bacterium]
MSGGTPRTLTDRGDRTPQPSRVPVAHLVRVLDYERPRLPSSMHRVAGLDEVTLGRGERDDVVRTAQTLALAVADPRMSQQHARLVCAAGRWTIEDCGSRNGTFVDGAKLDRAELTDGTLIETGRTAYLFRMLESVEPADLTAGTQSSPLGELHTFSPPFARALANVARIALSAQSIVLVGETGTGKEVLARGVHAASRRGGAFVAVNCGALPDTLVESELFGYRKGAFSGATEDRPGLVRGADQGTLFLDEIGDLPLDTQAALLRVLQEREVMPIGATKPITVDIRVVAASHRDLEAEVAAGRFREDLFARLAGYVVEIPPVRERREDLGILIAALLGRLAADVRFAPAAGTVLLRYGWSRNVRELEQALGSATALANDGVVELEHLPRALQAPPGLREDLSPSELERRDELRVLLAKHRGNIAAVGRELGVARMQVHRWLDRFGIDVAEFRD